MTIPDSENSSERFDASVVICTHNRGKILRKSLLAVVQQNCGKYRFEIIVVDNGSTDNTKSVVEEVVSQNDSVLKYVFEENIGLSHARNTGVKHAAGKIIVFTDDDAVPQENWLKHIVDAFANNQSHAATNLSPMVVGGDVVPVWPGCNPPPWLHKSLHTYLGITQFNYCEPTKLYYPEYPFGVNIAFRAEAFKHGGFSTDLGRSGASLLSGEEVEMCRRLADKGETILYTPNAIVNHLIAKERINKIWFRKRAYTQGASKAIIEVGGEKFAKVLGLFFKRLTILIGSFLGVLFFTITMAKPLAFVAECKMRMSWAYLCQVLR